MLDAAVIGTGPAGLSAAIHFALHNITFIWFGAPDMSLKVEKSEKIANYPGLGLLTGEELNQKFRSHAREMGLSITDKMVTSILQSGTGYTLLAGNDIYETRTILLATGAAMGKGIPGESEWLGRGVSYCATCDGFLYKGKTIAVYCAAPRFEPEVAYLAELANTVYWYTPYPVSSQLSQLSNPFREIYGDNRVSGITLTDGTRLPVDGVFILRTALAPAVLLPGLATDGPHILVNRAMETNFPGCYAAGDCTGRPYQIAKAVGEGNVAAHSMTAYLKKRS